MARNRQRDIPLAHIAQGPMALQTLTAQAPMMVQIPMIGHQIRDMGHHQIPTVHRQILTGHHRIQGLTPRPTPMAHRPIPTARQTLDGGRAEPRLPHEGDQS
jgi:hypothetical protein